MNGKAQADDAHGHQPERERKGDQPCKRPCSEPEDKAQGHFTDSARTGGFQQ